MDVLGHLALFIPLNEERQLALGIGRRDGRVWPDDRLVVLAKEGLLSIARGFDYDTGCDGQQRSFAIGQFKDVPDRRGTGQLIESHCSGIWGNSCILGRVVVVWLDLFELELDKVVGVERALFLHLLGGDLGLGAVDVNVGCESSNT